MFSGFNGFAAASLPSHKVGVVDESRGVGRPVRRFRETQRFPQSTSKGPNYRNRRGRLSGLASRVSPAAMA